MLGQSVVLQLVLCSKTLKADVTTVRAMDTLVVFSKLTYAVTSELTQGALPLHSTWVSFMVLLHVVLQSLWGEEVLGTELTLINMHLSVYPKPRYSFKFFVAKSTPYYSILMFP